MNEKLHTDSMEKLLKAFILLSDEDEAAAFLEDLCTIKEIQDMAQRLEVASLLQKKVTYADIAEQTGASTVTISRVNRCLVYGAGGYGEMLKKLEETDD